MELQAFRWNLRQLTVEVDGLTIHGLEGPGELPYAHIDRLYARAKILSFFDARFGLDYLEVDRPPFISSFTPTAAPTSPSLRQPPTAAGR